MRVEAGHLRRSLDRYYLGAGRTEAVAIAIPKGGYAPSFEWRHRPKPAAPMEAVAPPVPAVPRRWRLVPAGLGAALIVVLALGVGLSGSGSAPVQPDIPRLLVQPFESLSGSDSGATIARGLTAEVVGQISKFRDIIVVAADAEGNPLVPPAAQAPRYALNGSVEIVDDDLRLQARILSRADGAVVWANTYTDNLTVSGLLQIEKDIAEQVATTLAQPYGVIFQADAARQVENPPADWSAYACTLSYYAYRTTLDPAAHAAVRSCLEAAVARFPTYATAWALLSQTYIDELRFRFPTEPGEAASPVERAAAAARKAVALEPTNIRGLEAQMFALFFAGDMEAAIRVGRQAMAINPNDTELMGEFGYRLALFGDWTAGCALVQQARERNPGPLGYYESALALCAYQAGDLDEAAMWIRKSPMPDNPQYHVIAATILGEKGDPAAAAEVTWIEHNAPKVYADARKELSARIGRTEDVDRFVASLQKAGFPADSD